MKYLPTLFAFLAFLVIILVTGCESSVPTAAELDTTPLYGPAHKTKAHPTPPGLAPIDSTGFMTVEKDTSGWE